MGSSCHQNLLWNSISMQKRAEAQECYGGWICLLKAFPCQSDLGNYRVRVICSQQPSPGQQSGSLVLIAFQVVREAASRLFNIGSSLIQRQGQAIQEFHNQTGTAAQR